MFTFDFGKKYRQGFVVCFWRLFHLLMGHGLTRLVVRHATRMLEQFPKQGFPGTMPHLRTSTNTYSPSMIVPTQSVPFGRKRALCFPGRWQTWKSLALQAMDMRLFGRYIRCSWVANAAHFDLDSVNPKNAAWWLEAGCSIQSSVLKGEMMNCSVFCFRFMEIDMCKPWWRTWRGFSKQIHTCTHIGQAKESVFTLRVLKAGLPVCPLALRALPIGSLEDFFQNSSFCCSVCCFAGLVVWYRTFTANAYQTIADDFPVYYVYFSCASICLCVIEPTKINIVNSSIKRTI